MALKWDENLKYRVISAALLVPVVVLIIWAGQMLFNALLLAAAVVMAFEWCGIINHNKEMKSSTQRYWMIAGIVYIVLSILSLMYLRQLEEGFVAILYLFILVWVVDIFAFISGKTIGGPKIWPQISPNKTWAGLVGAMIGAAIVNITLGLFFSSSIIQLAIMGIMVAVIAQTGDFFESWVKRQFGVKDSGTLIPGHGGILDRVDGIATSGPVIALMALLNHGAVPLWS